MTERLVMMRLYRDPAAYMLMADPAVARLALASYVRSRGNTWSSSK